MDNTSGQNLDAGSDDDMKIDPALELSLLKDRARMMGMTFSNNISKEKLQERVNAKMAGEVAPEGDDEKEDDVPRIVNPLVQDAPVVPKKKMNLRDHLIKENMKLVRVRIMNLDPKKKDLPGEILTIANAHLGTVRKFIPFGEVTEDGYHVPYCLYKMMDARKFLHIRTRKVKGRTVIEQTWAKEFALEILPPLTTAELKNLATAQIAAGSNDSV